MGQYKSKSTKNFEECRPKKSICRKVVDFFTLPYIPYTDIKEVMVDAVEESLADQLPDNAFEFALEINNSKLKERKEEFKQTDNSCFTLIYITGRDDLNETSNSLLNLTSKLDCLENALNEYTKAEKLIQLYSNPKYLNKGDPQASVNYAEQVVYKNRFSFWPIWGRNRNKDAALKDKSARKENKLPELTVHHPEKIKFCQQVSFVAFDNKESISSLDDSEDNFRKRLRKEEHSELVDLSDQPLPTKLTRKSQKRTVQRHVRKTVKKANLELFSSGKCY
ncbi:hypothetical protein ILUMI_03722 [Ignelater luminosus]|uniref:Uncharacterized protein n=1 Tax=Ignelater luminosus TaxID=2038154 RepID=A0A8K0DB10_IGNLU|nr:hypothetical protein ILUMI_03722 [Ignelater luminosus]